MSSPLFGNLALLVWACLFFGAFGAYGVTAPDGDGFTRGTNRVLIFLALQAAAVLPAVLALPSARARQKAWMQWASRVPAMLAALLFGALVLFVLYGIFAVDSGSSPQTSEPFDLPAKR